MADENRNERMKFRLPLADRDRVVAAAKKAGMPVESFIRAIVLIAVEKSEGKRND